MAELWVLFWRNDYTHALDEVNHIGSYTSLSEIQQAIVEREYGEMFMTIAEMETEQMYCASEDTYWWRRIW